VSQKLATKFHDLITSSTILLTNFQNYFTWTLSYEWTCNKVMITDSTMPQTLH